MDDFTKRRIEKIMRHYMESAAEEQLRNRRSIGYSLEGDEVMLIEQRPSKDGAGWIELPVAQFRLDAGGWNVYGMDSGGRWRPVPEIPPSDDFQAQLNRVAANDLGIF
ncbi:DUF3024 domain-containing protein [Saccharibacillus brassicae]